MVNLRKGEFFSFPKPLGDGTFRNLPLLGDDLSNPGEHFETLIFKQSCPPWGGVGHLKVNTCERSGSRLDVPDSSIGLAGLLLLTHSQRNATL